MKHLTPPNTPNPGTTGDAAAMLDTALRLHGATAVGLTPGEAILVPTGMSLESVRSLYEEWLRYPERRVGTATLDDLDSFVAHVNRFKDSDSAIFATLTEDNPSFLAVLDYHRAGPPSTDQAARWMKHRSHHKPVISEVWRAWKDLDGKPMNQGAFAAVLEDRTLDIAPPPETDDEASTRLIAALGGRYGDQPTLLDNARNLRLREDATVSNATNLSTGEIEVVYKTELRSEHGGPVRLPSCFSVMAPVFEGGAPYRLWIRIRIRRQDEKVLWILQRWRPDLIIRDALTGMRERIQAETGITVLAGRPE